MTEKKNWGSTVMGWFVVQEDSAPGDTAIQEDTTSSDPAASEPSPVVFNTPPPAAPGGKVDYDQVFEAAGIDAEERDRVSRTLGLLESLPPGTDDTVRKQIVLASLRAFNVPIEKIIEAGAADLQ